MDFNENCFHGRNLTFMCLLCGRSKTHRTTSLRSWPVLPVWAHTSPGKSRWHGPALPLNCPCFSCFSIPRNGKESRERQKGQEASEAKLLVSSFYGALTSATLWGVLGNSLPLLLRKGSLYDTQKSGCYTRFLQKDEALLSIRLTGIRN